MNKSLVTYQYRGSLGASSVFLWFLFFIPPVFSNLEKIETTDAYNDKRWQALLHSSDQGFNIKDPSFYLGSTPPALKSEYEAATALLFESKNKELLCRFPARAFWLNRNNKTYKPDFSHCKELTEFLQKVPHDQISVVFSSENLASPSSMMGHILLKVSGTDANGTVRNHAISFFTQIDPINIPKTVFESLITGKHGIFALSPYQDKLEFYLTEEGRNVWEYELDLSEFDIKLLMLHIWELKLVEHTYFFDSYNCATLISFMVAVSTPEAFAISTKRLSPIDVIKTINNKNMVVKRSVITAPRWQARMLSDAIGDHNTKIVTESIKTGDIQLINTVGNSEEKYLMLELAKRYTDILHTDSKLTAIQKSNLDEEIMKSSQVFKNYYKIDLSDYKSPILTPPDSQWSMGIQEENDEQFINFLYLPASHSINDDNRQYFSENELKIGEISLLLSNSEVILDELTLYKVQSIIPSKPMLGGLSGKFYVGSRRVYDEELEKHHQTEVSIGLGKAKELYNEDITVFGLLSTAFAYGKEKAYVTATPEMGIIIRERSDFKTFITFEHRWNYLKSNDTTNVINITQSKYFKNNWALMLNYELAANNSDKEETFAINFKRYF